LREIRNTSWFVCHVSTISPATSFNMRPLPPLG
jgi:hypothetical protein